MDKKLRQLENQSLPDLSKQDHHWQLMQQLLQPGIPVTQPPPAKPGFKKWWPWMLAACIIGTLAIIGYNKLVNHPDKEEEKITTAPIPSSTEKKSMPDLYVPTPAPTVTVNNSNRASNKIQVSAPRVTYIGKPVSGDTAIPEPVVTNQPVLSKKETVTLAGFFKQIEKQPQEIIIEPGIDNLVKGTEGTALLIPANTFNTTSSVTLLLKEYYTYQDIITNKLSTTSDGEPLVTGGMIHIQAFADGKELLINPGKSIRWFIPDTSQNMNGMQLFTGTVQRKAILRAGFQTSGGNSDTVSGNGKFEMINWVADKQDFTRSYLQTSVKVLDLKDNPYMTRETKKGIVGKFHISSNPKISKKQLQEELKAKYGYYKVKIRSWGDDKFRSAQRKKAEPISGSYQWYSYEDVGDSAWISKELAARYKLKATDSITYTRTGFVVSSGNYVKKAFSNVNLSALSNKYSVDISTLGWINCDRFYRDNGPKTDYFVNLSDTAANYYTVLVFEQMKSMMMGYTSGNRVIFPNLPRGIKAKVISIGIRDGKSVAAMERVPADGNNIGNLKFEETSPASFREQAAMIDK